MPPAPTATFDEMRALLKRLPGPDLASQTKVLERQATLVKPAGALGRLETLAEWLGGWQGRANPRVDRPRIAVFAGAHGVAARGVSAYPPSVTAQMVQTMISGGAAINQIAGSIDADLRVYEMDLAHPVGDFTQGPAMDEARCAQAMAYGMMAAEPGVDVLCLGEMGIGNTASAAALCLALFGGAAADWTGPGTGVHGERLALKTRAVEDGVARWKGSGGGDALSALAAVGGEELAAIAGAVLAARMGRIPVLLDGYACTAAAAVLFRLDPRSLDHCVVAHRSAEPGHARLLDAIGQKPLYDMGLRLGEGTGAALAVPLLKAAAACHAGMATFDQAAVDGPA